ncbi:helix-turn-helix domain-containing protein [Lactiplantibacillus plantarum]|uniref:helix-turn-helix domain-containing protein n=1 Tax=Lactiplantibacillus plantarum TaxID=1590 RepID=UPI0014028580|nr:helix-turn-helix domain-containing protein [Lactiplantibacillus plantarum]MBT9655543.1 helix-turn-helix domain-containing protein [Lactiplantibacillus plantarum]
MIRNRLAELLAERRLKISRVSNDIPNLSRNTITSTAQNDTKMIQNETINSLCQYLGISPADFFEYLPFDVSFSASANNITGIVTSNVDVSQLIVTNIELDLYAKQTFLNPQYEGKNQTFDLTVKQVEPATIPMLLDGGESWTDKTTNIYFSIMLGHTSDTETYETQHNSFNNFWNTITPGFMPIVQGLLMDECTRATREGIEKSLENTEFDINEYYDPSVDWKKVKGMYTFSFKNAFSEQKSSGATIKFQPAKPSANKNNDPFSSDNNDQLDISDDDLPF